MTQVIYYDRVNRCYDSMVIVIVRVVYDEIYDEMMIWFVVAVAVVVWMESQMDQMDLERQRENLMQQRTGKDSSFLA